MGAEEGFLMQAYDERTGVGVCVCGGGGGGRGCSLLSASVTVCSSDFPPVVARGRRRRIDRQAGRQADWQAGRQTGRHVQMDSKVNQAGM